MTSDPIEPLERLRDDLRAVRLELDVPGADEADAEQLYELLEREVVPTYRDNRPRWVEMMKASIAELAPRFSMQRVVIEYVEGYYLPAHASARR